MNYRGLGKTGFKVSEISLGTWQIGGRWGDNFNEKTAIDTLNRAVDLGINFIDTADVYNDGLSEKVIGKLLKSRRGEVKVATKCGRRLNPHVAEGYSRENIRGFVHDSLKNMDIETIDLIQLHCPPTEVYSSIEAFEALEELKKEGKILHYGVSVEKVEEALKAIENPNVETVQIIFNMFRQKPAELFFKEAKKKDIGVIVRVPLASGLLTGKFAKATSFESGDHRFFNRNGEAFDKGETFSGIDYNKGLEAVEELKKVFPENSNLAHYALRYILMFDAVSCVIPGASMVSQAESNVEAVKMAELTEEQMAKVKEIYNKYFKKGIHHLW
jgi:aryl-alcohol dehydrogenase-like predicted oxidoreductase